MNDATESLGGDTIIGAASLAEFLSTELGVPYTPRMVYHDAERGRWPLFRIGSNICGRRSRIRKHVLEQESMAARG